MYSNSSVIKITESLLPFFKLIKAHDKAKRAIVSDQFNITYGEFSDRVTQLAFYLFTHCKIKKGDLIAVRMNKNPNFIVTIFALWSIGAAYLPLDSKRHTEHEQISLYKHSGAKYLLTESQENGMWHFKTNIESDKILTLEQFEIDIKNYDVKPIQVEVTGNDLAYVIYTSGSTGTPKGVEIAHRGLVQFFRAHQEILKITSDSIIAQYASWGFDASLAEIVMAFGCGASLCMIPEHIMLDISKLTNFYNTYKISHSIFVPKVLSYLNPDQFLFLRGFIITGEKYLKSLFVPWLEKGCLVANGYGPTETTIGCTLGLCTKDRPIGLGQPIGDINIYRWNQTENRFYRKEEEGEGELYVTGKGLMLGYRNNREETDKVLINMKKPDSNEITLFYKTGDYAHLEDGELVFACRRDRLKKIYGKQVNLDKVEKIIQENIKISNAIIEYDGQIIGYFCVTEEFDIHIFYNKLKSYLPYYKLPNKIALLNTLPLLPRSQKVNYKILETPEFLQKANSCIDRVLPRDFIEKIIAEVWSNLTKTPLSEIYIDTNYIFHLGKGSLDLTSMLLEVSAALKKQGIEDGNISLESFCSTNNVTIAYIARYLRRSRYQTTSTIRQGRKDGANPTLYLIHTVTGDAVTDYQEFIRGLEIDTEIIAINARRLNDIGVTIEEIALDYAKIIFDKQNKNPCYLIGWSTGGIIAREVAGYLTNKGIICKCSIVDSLYPEDIFAMDWNIFQKYCFHNYEKLSNIYNISKRLPIDYFSEKKSRKEILLGMFDFLLACNETSSKENIAKARALKMAELCYIASNHIPDIWLYIAQESLLLSGKNLGWGNFFNINSITTIRKVDHFTIMTSMELKQHLKEQYQALYRNVIKRLQEEGRYEDSLQYLTTLLKYKRQDTELLMLRGRAFAHIADRELALVEFTKIINILEKKQQIHSQLYIQSLFERAITYQRLSDYQSGEECNNSLQSALCDFLKIIEINPQHAEAYYHSAIIYFARNEHQRGFHMIDKSLEINPKDANAYYYRGKQYLALDKYENAIHDLICSLDFRPGHKDTQAMLAEAIN